MNYCADDYNCISSIPDMIMNDNMSFKIIQKMNYCAGDYNCISSISDMIMNDNMNFKIQ